MTNYKVHPAPPAGAAPNNKGAFARRFAQRLWHPGAWKILWGVQGQNLLEMAFNPNKIALKFLSATNVPPNALSMSLSCAARAPAPHQIEWFVRRAGAARRTK